MNKETQMPQEPDTKDACELLDADHLAVKHLFVAYARLAVLQAEPAARQALAQQICQDLTVHATMEEEVFYPALRPAIDAPELLDEAQAEHQQAKEMIARIESLPEANEAMDDLVSELARAIEQHVKEERDLLFPKARASGLDLLALAQQLKARQAELEAQLA